MINVEELATSTVATVQMAGDEATFGFDATNWADADIRGFIEHAQTVCAEKSVKLKGVRLGADIFMRLGGASGDFLNAQLQNGVPLVQVEHFGILEMVFRS